MAFLLASRREELRDNLRKQFTLIHDTDSVEGSGWYPLAQSIVRQWAEHYRYSVDTVAMVVAAISPQVEWSRNLIIADDVLANRIPSIGGVLHVNLRKAEKLRDTDYRSESKDWSLESRMLEQFKAGPKVLNFARNLSGNMNAVTVDTHAMQCALNDPLSKIVVRPSNYAIVADCYREVATEKGLQPATFQAVLWHSWKRQYPRVWKIQNRTEWSAMGEY